MYILPEIYISKVFQFKYARFNGEEKKGSRSFLLLYFFTLIIIIIIIVIILLKLDFELGD